MARDKPFPHLTNEQVIQNAEQMYYGGELQVSVTTTKRFIDCNTKAVRISSRVKVSLQTSN